jgi:hypothetical protein
VILTVIRCEICKKELDFPFTPAQFAHDNQLPNGWYIVSTGEWRNQEPWHLCSEGCLHQWSILRTDNKKQYVSDEYGGLTEQEMEPV